MKIIIAGAGSIGCFVGGLLLRAGRDVHFLARPRIADQLAKHGLRVSDYAGLDAHMPAEDVPVSLSPEVMADADLILVTVKSGATADIAKDIAAHAPEHATVISLQNGVSNAAILREALPGRDVRSGMVPYNVVQMGEGRFHRGTGADIVIESGPGDLAEQLRVSGLKIRESGDIAAVQWGKLLINLNNALNALSGITLYDQFAMHGWRTLLADQIEEGMAAFKAARIEDKPALPIKPKTFLRLLRLPTPLLRLVAQRMLKIDRAARSSMWEDLQMGRMTEIDALQGAIIRLGEQYGVATPINARVAKLIKSVEGKPNASPGLTPKEVRGQ